MKKRGTDALIVVVCFFIVCLVSCLAQGGEERLLDLPPELRTHNYARGSCCHAALIDLLRWHGDHEAAEKWKEKYSGAQAVAGGRNGGLAEKLEAAGFRYAYTTNGDEKFLEWCSRNRHGAVIHYYVGHAVTFRGYADGFAILQNNNNPDRVIRVKKADFIKRWKGYGGCALTLVYNPYPPAPRLEGTK